MVIVKPTETIQQITVFVRDHSATEYRVEIEDEQQKVFSFLVNTGAYNGESLDLDISYNFEAERWYMVRIYALPDGDLINISKVYSTSQEEYENYSVLDDYYIQIEKPATQFITKKSL